MEQSSNKQNKVTSNQLEEPLPMIQVPTDASNNLTSKGISHAPFSSIQYLHDRHSNPVIRPILVGVDKEADLMQISNSPSSKPIEPLPSIHTLFPREYFPPPVHVHYGQQQQQPQQFQPQPQQTSYYNGSYFQPVSEVAIERRSSTELMMQSNADLYSRLSSLPSMTQPEVSEPVHMATYSDKATSLSGRSRTPSPTNISTHSDDGDSIKSSDSTLSGFMSVCSPASRSVSAVTSGKETYQPVLREGGWTEQEQKFFLQGVKECGWGNWKEISSNYVRTRTRKQVASHAQKFLLKLRKMQAEKSDSKPR